MTHAHTLIPDLRRSLEVPDDGTLSKTVFQDDRIKVVLFGFDAGQELSEHTASSPAVIQVLEGEADLTLGQDRITVGPGAWVHMPAHLPHAVRAVSRLVMLLTLLRGEAAR